MISHRLWQRRFARIRGQWAHRDPGRPELHRHRRDAAGFRFPLDEEPADVWAGAGNLYRFDRQWRGYKALPEYRAAGPGDGAGARARRGGVDRRAAVAALPKESAGRTITLAPYDRTVRTGRTAFLIVLAAVGVVLLVACANVANLQLVRATRPPAGTGHPRGAGGGAGPIIRQFLTESLLLAALAGALGLAVGGGGAWIVPALLPDDVPRVYAVRFDGRVLAYTLAAALGTALAVGLAPALQAIAHEPAGHLEGRGTGNHGRPRRFGAHCWWRRSAWQWPCWPGSGCWFAASPG